jgi:biotin carboxyl carrier protein
MTKPVIVKIKDRRGKKVNLSIEEKWSFLRVGVDGRLFDVDPKKADTKSRIEVIRQVPTSLAGGETLVQAPMPGVVEKVMVREGEAIAAGQGLVLLLAMKMENEICAEFPGTVKSVYVKMRQIVKTGDNLVKIGVGK